MKFVGERITSLVGQDPVALLIYERIFGKETIAQADVDAALDAGNVLPHGLLEAASSRLGISVDVGSEIADQP